VYADLFKQDLDGADGVGGLTPGFDYHNAVAVNGRCVTGCVLR
jgi:hypothetical protein